MYHLVHVVHCSCVCSVFMIVKQAGISSVVFTIAGESNVYTIGYIGSQKVVSTKLPMIGRQMAAQISSGNTTTRLLGNQLAVQQVTNTR